MCEGYVVVGDIVEEVYFALVEEETGSDGMDWSITPSFVEETTILIETLEKVDIWLGSKPVKITDFKVGPLPMLAQKKPDVGSNLRNGTCCMSHRCRRSRTSTSYPQQYAQDDF